MWQIVLFHGCWIIGLAILLAMLSYYHWVSGQNKQMTSTVSQFMGSSVFSGIGLMLISLGLAGTSQQSWELVVWGIFALLSLVWTVRVFVHSQ